MYFLVLFCGCIHSLNCKLCMTDEVQWTCVYNSIRVENSASCL